MPTAYLKKLAKLNKVSVNKLEKFWAQAKEIAKSEGQGKAWGLITSIFQNKLKKEGYKIKAITYTSLNSPESTKKFYEDLENELKEYRKCTAFKEEIRKSDSGQIFKFQRLSLSSIQKLLKYYLEDNEFDSTTHWNDLYSDSDGIVYIEYDGNKTFYSVTNPLIKDLNTSNIRNCIIEYPDYTAYFGKDCRIEKFDGKEDAPWVVKSSKVVSMYEPDTLDSTTKNKLDYINQVKECIKQIWARSIRSHQEACANEWVIKYSRLIDDCINAFEEPKVCARMMYIKYHKENPSTRDLNKNHDTDFYTLLKEAKQYFEGLKKFKEDEKLLNELSKQVTASTKVYSLKPFLYKKHTIYASSKEEAIQKIISSKDEDEFDVIFKDCIEKCEWQLPFDDHTYDITKYVKRKYKTDLKPKMIKLKNSGNHKWKYNCYTLISDYINSEAEKRGYDV